VFVCVLFKNAFSGLDHITSNGRMIDELEMMWNKVVMTCFKVLVWHLRGGTEENFKKPQSQ
jgi:hypothetical protein